MKIYQTSLSESIEFYQDQDTQYRWRIRGRNGRIIAASSEKFNDHDAAVGNFRLMATITTSLINQVK